jgi:hypothetical protein
MPDKPKARKPAVDRRNFLKVLSVSAAASAAPPLAAEAVAQGDTDEKRKARYRLSEEVKTFYRVNRYP